MTTQPEIQKSRLSSTQAAQTHVWYLHGDIDEAENFIDVVKMLRNASANDTVTIYINSGGGYLHTALQIINAMNECKAPIKTVVDAFAASAATLIFLAGDQHEIADHSTFMCHHWHGGSCGKGHEIVAEIEAKRAIYDALAHESYKGFLSDAEIDQMIAGKDFWFSAAEVRERLKKTKSVT